MGFKNNLEFRSSHFKEKEEFPSSEFNLLINNRADFGKDEFSVSKNTWSFEFPVAKRAKFPSSHLTHLGPSTSQPE